MVKVGIIGATGYAGNELVRLLLGHKDVEIVVKFTKEHWNVHSRCWSTMR